MSDTTTQTKAPRICTEALAHLREDTTANGLRVTLSRYFDQELLVIVWDEQGKPKDVTCARSLPEGRRLLAFEARFTF